MSATRPFATAGIAAALSLLAACAAPAQKSAPCKRPADLTGYDRALVDAPCSGLGVLAARPDLRWRATPLPELQLALLRAAIERTRTGGTVVYSVCTINAAESEDVVDAVVADGTVALDRTLAEEWPQYRHRHRPEFLQTLPHLHGTSGFFVARLIVV